MSILCSKSFILILVLFVFTTSLLIGCSDNQEVQEESLIESQADILYDYKTPYIGDNSKVGNILSNLNFPEGYRYESMALFTDAQPYKLQVNLITDNESGFPRSKFEFLSAVIFSLIGNLDEIQYTPKDEE
ncbi:MAG TPA: DUF4825 domain-containing protein, partial [Epulopiscium sp.]|nr:DUF4825 domain-containing protein [Candidatus Epulonipiscium sp.]